MAIVASIKWPDSDKCSLGAASQLVDIAALPLSQWPHALNCYQYLSELVIILFRRAFDGVQVHCQHVSAWRIASRDSTVMKAIGIAILRTRACSLRLHSRFRLRWATRDKRRVARRVPACSVNSVNVQRWSRRYSRRHLSAIASTSTPATDRCVRTATTSPLPS